MNTKQIGIYMILVGVIIFILFFIGQIVKFIVTNPILGLAFIAIIAGAGLLVYNLLQEQKRDAENESFKGIEK
ncbi:MAG: hypothetical protein ACE5D2_07880 [Fidelibacterota bacterium]